MSSVVFILGAGASRQCGGPLMGDFLDIASDLLRSKRVDEKRAEFERVFFAIGAMQTVHSKAQLDLTNIESIFTALELGNIIQRVPGLGLEEIPLTMSALKELIVKTLEVTIRFPTRSGHIGTPKPYDSFAKLLDYLRNKAFPPQSVSVITFNYDIAADMALFRAEMGPDYVIEAPLYCRAPVQLLKLHGSLNWATEKESRRIRPLHLSAYLEKYSLRPFDEGETAFVPIGTHLAEYFSEQQHLQVDPEPVIVPPSWNKADYHHALSDIWAAAAKHLSEAEYIFLIGYSLPETDSFFRHLYALGSVGKTTLRKIVVFNPDISGGVDDRFRRLLGPGAASRYEYVPLGFEGAIREIQSLFPKRT